MKSKFYRLMNCFIMLIIIGCQEQQLDGQPSVLEQGIIENHINIDEYEDHLAHYELVEVKNIDFNLDGSEETVKLYEKHDIGLHIKVMVNDQEQNVHIRHASYAKFDRVISLGEQGQALIIALDRNHREDIIEYPIHQQYSYIIVGFIDDQLSILLDGSQLPFQEEENYHIAYEGSEVFTLHDSSTDFGVTFKLDVVEDYRQMFELSVRDEASIHTSFSTDEWFIPIQVEDVHRDGIDEIVLTKMISGYYRNLPLGFFEYTYHWNNHEYVLKKEVYFTAFGVAMLDQKVIKEVSFP